MAIFLRTRETEPILLTKTPLFANISLVRRHLQKGPSMTKSTVLVVALSAGIALASFLSATQYRQGAQYWESRANREMERAESIAGQKRSCNNSLSSARQVSEVCRSALQQTEARLRDSTRLITEQEQVTQDLLTENESLERQVRILCPAVADEVFPPSNPPHSVTR